MIHDVAPAATVTDGATREAIDAIATALSQPVPSDLTAMLRESDGVDGEWGDGVIWPATDIIRINLTFRNDRRLYRFNTSFDGLLFFADAGNGDQFAYQPGGSIIRWNHETDDRSPFAPNLRAYIRKRLTDLEWA
jgi:hypothetical protein